MSGFPDNEPSSSSAQPPPPYSVSASGRFSAGPGWPSSLHPSDAAITSTSHSASDETVDFWDSKWRLTDPRPSSSHSLAPSSTDGAGDSRRTLLIVYIHGFYGNEASFRSFPAHVHNYLKEALAETHVVHSKIYPRYKTYKAINVARDNFSQWLEPHESDSTDLILVGHSMGGLLAGEVALMPNGHPDKGQQFKHRILGTVSLDSPFLGLHPGIVVAGISSLFRPASPPKERHDQSESPSSHLTPINSPLASPTPSILNLETSSSLDAELSPSPSNSASLTCSNGPPPKPDPLFNPPFWNDINLKDRSFMKRLGHFAKKHSAEGIWDATKNHVMSHLEYGGCLADYPGLHARYNKLRALEDVDPLKHLSEDNSSGNNFNRAPLTRVRFINYFTLSTGRPKKPKSPMSPVSPAPDLVSGPPSTLHVAAQLPPQESSTPRISVENTEYGERAAIMSSIETVDAKLSTLQMEQKTKVDRDPEKAGAAQAQGEDVSEKLVESKGKGKQTVREYDVETSEVLKQVDELSPSEEPSLDADPSGDAPPNSELPPIPDLPEPPTPPDLDKYIDKDARKQAEKEAKRAQKAYDQAVKSRDKAIKERQKLVEKRRKKAEKEAQKEAQRLAKEEQKQRKQEQEAQRQEAEEGQRQEPPEAAVETPMEGLTESETPAPATSIAPPAGQPPPPPIVSSAAAGTPTTAPASSAASIATTQTEAKRAAAAGGESAKPKKERKFCTLPRNKANGKRDDTWVPVFMQGVDEVGAHCGLFVPGPHYDGLIGDVGGRIVGWVQDDLTVRVIMGMS